VSFALTPVGAGDGGFCCIAGSHKGNIPASLAMRRLESPQTADGVTQPVLEPGDAVIFNEACTHGANPLRLTKNLGIISPHFCLSRACLGKPSLFIAAGKLKQKRCFLVCRHDAVEGEARASRPALPLHSFLSLGTLPLLQLNASVCLSFHFENKDLICQDRLGTSRRKTQTRWLFSPGPRDRGDVAH
jgi:hypothetical protein